VIRGARRASASAGDGPGAARGSAGDGPRVAVVGGGHGLAATIRAARSYAGQLTAVVATADDGGSTGRLRSAIDMPAPGDVRRCVEAMAGDADGLLARALEYRFAGSDVEGHALGNLLLAGLQSVTGDFAAAVEELSRLVGVDPCGRVLPATTDPVVLQAETTDGRRVTGQVAISATVDIERVVLQPADAAVPSDAVDALVDADQVVLGPGSLYTSVLAAAVVEGVRDALKRTAGRRVYVCNVRAELAETRGYDVAAHLDALHRHGIEADVVLAQRGALPQGDVGHVGGAGVGAGVEVVEADVVRPNGRAHDPALLGAALARLVP
jgi:uncharacterized cofD-like protein